MTGTFVISLDLELMWGVRSGRTREQYGHRVLGVRQAIPAILDAFERQRLNATWATVGFAMCEGREELLARAPEQRPSYDDPYVSNYSYLHETGKNEHEDPYYFAPSLIRKISSCPGQELGTHSFSHYYCLEPGQTREQFAADLDASIGILQDFGAQCRSIVFPRNQYGPEHLEICRSRGVKAFRGNEDSWCYRPGNKEAQTPLHRIMRLADSILPLTGDHTTNPEDIDGILNLPSSRFLRPYNRRQSPLDGAKLSRITKAMTGAAQRGEIFHLWWHPHNFGADLNENMAMLEHVTEHFRQLSDRFGMASRSMGDIAA